MKRKAIKIDGNLDGTTCFLIDADNAEQILNYVFRENVEREFREIRDILKQNLRNKEKYCKVNISNQTENMYEMRFTKDGKNDRIYCQEIHRNKKRFIVMIELFAGNPEKNKRKNSNNGRLRL